MELPSWIQTNYWFPARADAKLLQQFRPVRVPTLYVIASSRRGSPRCRQQLLYVLLTLLNVFVKLLKGCFDFQLHVLKLLAYPSLGTLCTFLRWPFYTISISHYRKYELNLDRISYISFYSNYLSKRISDSRKAIVSFWWIFLTTNPISHYDYSFSHGHSPSAEYLGSLPVSSPIWLGKLYLSATALNKGSPYWA